MFRHCLDEAFAKKVGLEYGLRTRDVGVMGILLASRVPVIWIFG